MRCIPIIAAAVALSHAAPAQELLWHIASTTDDYGLARGSFGDMDGDGGNDLLMWHYYNLYGGGPPSAFLRIVSGATGAVLDDNPVPPPMYDFVGIGDFNGDGSPDYAITWTDNGSNNLDYVQIWSPLLDRELLRLTGPRAITFGGRLAGRVDLDGDGLSDLVVASTHGSNPDVRAYSHTGALLYRVALAPLAMLPLDVLGLRDLDGDGCSEILIGGTEYTQGYTRGMLAVLSGRTGAFLRVTFDQIPGDIMGFPIASAGDVDGDGVEDYATGNHWGNASGRKLIAYYSGATGVLLRQWTVPFPANLSLATSLIACRDVDLDGMPDPIASAPTWYNGLNRDGRIQVFSWRDQQILLHTDPLTDTYSPSYAYDLVDLGSQPGSPFPVFAMTYRPTGGPPFVRRRLEVWRCSVPGERMAGAGCTTTGLQSTTSVRRVTTGNGDQCRVVLGNAPPGATAFCVIAGKSESTFAGAPLPYALDGLGYPGCALQVPPTLIEVRTVGIAGFDRGYAEIDAPFQLDTVGFDAALQWLVFDFATGAYTATPRCEVTLR